MDDHWNVCMFSLSLEISRVSSRLELWMQTSTSHWVVSMVSEVSPPLRSLEPIRTSQRNTKVQIITNHKWHLKHILFCRPCFGIITEFYHVFQVDAVARPSWMEL